MSRLLVFAAHDARLQFRYGIYFAYGFVVAFYLAIIVLGRDVLPDWAIALIVYSDPAAVGFFFLGALMMLEKAEGVRAALAATPATAAQYFTGKVVTLVGLALIACSLLLLVHGAGNSALLLGSVALTSVAFLGIGVPIALRFRTVNGYLIGSGAFLTPVIAPAAFALLDPMPAWLALWPPIAQFRLILLAFGYGSATHLELSAFLAVCALAAAGGVVLALTALRRELGK